MSNALPSLLSEYIVTVEQWESHTLLPIVPSRVKQMQVINACSEGLKQVWTCRYNSLKPSLRGCRLSCVESRLLSVGLSLSTAAQVLETYEAGVGATQRIRIHHRSLLFMFHLSQPSGSQRCFTRPKWSPWGPIAWENKNYFNKLHLCLSAARTTECELLN